jgi:acyl carrier protein
MIVPVSDAQGIATSVGSTLAKTFGIELGAITPDTSLYDDIGADSLTVMELISALEDELGIELPESSEFALGIRTVRDLVEAFQSYAP